MLAKAQPFERAGLRFVRQDIASYSPEHKFDLVFSNAALQWLPDHEVLLPRLLSWVAEDGEIAVQVPFNHEHPSHRLAHATAVELFPETFSPDEDLVSVLPLERYAEQFREFLKVYASRLIGEVGDGAYFYAFKRLLFSARR